MDVTQSDQPSARSGAQVPTTTWTGAAVKSLHKHWLPIVIIGTAVLVLAVVWVRGDRNSAAMNTASDLLIVQAAMNQEGLSGFLPGNSARLSERLRQKHFTSVSILPSMAIGAHSIDVFGISVGTSLVLLKETGTNTWIVWRDVRIGSINLKSKVGKLIGP